MSANDVLYWYETCLPHSRGNTESENVREQNAGENMRQGITGDWNELHNEELHSELVFTKYYPMKFKEI
jgi:hypothetical protein